MKKKEEIDEIIKARNSVGDPYFVIYKKSNQETKTFRLALSIGKKYGNAVERNKIKRQLRNIIKGLQNELELKDYVIVIKPKAKELAYQEMHEKLNALIRKDKK